MTITATAPSLRPRSRWLSALAQMSTTFAMFLGPLILFRWPGRHDGWVRQNAAAAFDFQVSALLALYALAAVCIGISSVLGEPGSTVVLFVIPLAILAVHLLGLRGAVRVWSGIDPGYPPSLRLLRRRVAITRT